MARIECDLCVVNDRFAMIQVSAPDPWHFSTSGYLPMQKRLKKAQDAQDIVRVNCADDLADFRQRCANLGCDQLLAGIGWN